MIETDSVDNDGELEFETRLIKNYKEFYGRYKAEVPRLIREGYTPLNSRDIMYYRIKAFESGDINEKKYWFDNVFSTSDGLINYK